MTNITEASLADFIPDASNANKGTKRGQKVIAESLKEDGAARSIVVDENNNVVAGNKTLEAAIDIGIDKAIVVDTEGDELVVVRRKGWDLDDGGAARRYAYRDNRAGELSLDWDAEQLLADVDSGIDLDGMFLGKELDEILGTVRAEDYTDFEVQLEELEDYEDVTITIMIPRKYEEEVIEWLSEGEQKTQTGMGKGVLKRCGLL